MPSVSIFPLSGLLVAWTTGVLFGAEVIITVAYLRLLYMKGFKSKLDRIFLAVVIFQSVVSTGHMAACLKLAIDGLVYAQDSVAYFVNAATPAHVVQSALYVTNNILADGVLVWRLYVVWNKSHLICIPFLVGIMGLTVCSYCSVYLVARSNTPDVFFMITSKRWFVSSWSISIAIQISASVLISWKIWETHKSVSSFAIRTSRPMTVFWMILESGAVLSVTTTLLLAFYMQKSQVGAILAALLGQLDAVIPTAILLRVALYHTEGEPRTPSTRPSLRRTNLVGFQDEDQSNKSSGTRDSPFASSTPQDLELYELNAKLSMA